MYCLSFNLLEKRVLAPYCGCGILYPSALVGSCSNSCRSKGHPGKILFARDTVSFGQPTRDGILFESLLACRQQVLLRGCAYLCRCVYVSFCYFSHSRPKHHLQSTGFRISHQCGPFVHRTTVLRWPRTKLVVLVIASRH